MPLRCKLCCDPHDYHGDYQDDNDDDDGGDDDGDDDVYEGAACHSGANHVVVVTLFASS